MMTGMITWIFLILVFIVLLLILKGFCLIGPNQVGILTKNMFGKKMPEGQIIARHGGIGVQAKTLMPGLYWRLPIIWSFTKVPVVTVDIASIGIVESIDGEPLPKGRVLRLSKKYFRIFFYQIIPIKC